MRETPHLSIGTSNFAALRKPGVLLVDKTDLIARILSDPYHDELDQEAMKPADALAFRALSLRRASTEQCKEALRKLSQHLHRHHGEPVVILVDEYDTPLHEAFVHGYYKEAVGFFREFLSGGLMDNNHLFKGVLTGILRIARESLFSGLNNLGVYSLLSPKFATDFGFTEAEVQDLRARLRSPMPMEELRRWYDGYDFGGQVIYNPWSVISALGRPEEPFKAYWVNTASDELIRELLFRFGRMGPRRSSR